MSTKKIVPKKTKKKPEPESEPEQESEQEQQSGEEDVDKKEENSVDEKLRLKLVPFGKKMVHMPGLLRCHLAFRTISGGYPKSFQPKTISNEFKNIMLDIILHDDFNEDSYAGLTDEEQKYFDEICVYSKIFLADTDGSSGVSEKLAKLNSFSARDKKEMFNRFNLLRGEVLSGNNSIEVLKEMRNILLIMKSKRYIQKHLFDTLITDIVTCL